MPGANTLIASTYEKIKKIFNFTQTFISTRASLLHPIKDSLVRLKRPPPKAPFNFIQSELPPSIDPRLPRVPFHLFHVPSRSLALPLTCPYCRMFAPCSVLSTPCSIPSTPCSIPYFTPFALRSFLSSPRSFLFALRYLRPIICFMFAT